MASILWGHLPKDTGGWDSTPMKNPSLAPQDKTATSMRMLIHDTQSSLEKFSQRLDGLMTRVDDCRCQVINANRLLEDEREKMLAEMADITSNAHRELKSHIGAPAQKHALELVHATQSTTENGIQALEKRIDALQTLFQSHTNAITSVQDQQKAIQDQQNALLKALLPLLPLLQNLPLQVDQLKSSFSETISHATSNLETGIDGIKNSLQRLPSIPRHAPTKGDTSPTLETSNTNRKRTSSDAKTEPGGVSSNTSKRPRVDPPPTSSPRTHHPISIAVSAECALGTQQQLPSTNPAMLSPESRGITNPRKPPRQPGGAQQPLDHMSASVSPVLGEDHSSVYASPQTIPQTPQPKDIPKLPQPPGPLAQFLLKNGEIERRPSERNNLPPRGELRTNGIPFPKPAPTTSTLVPPPAFDAAHTASHTARHEAHPPNTGVFQRVRTAGPQPLRNAVTQNGLRSTPKPRPPANSDRPANRLSGSFSRSSPHNASSKSSKSMSLRDRRAQLSSLGRTQTRAFVVVSSSSDED